jgi:glutaredoxin
MELWQAEWCQHSHRVREKLTEKQIDFVARQVPKEPDDRDEMERAVGTREIPVLVTDEGRTIEGEDQILPWLEAAA